MKATLTVVYDACVLYPALLRDFLMWQGMSGCFHVRWSRAIHEEWKRNLLRNRPDLSRAQLDRISDLMDSAIPDALVENYQSLMADLNLPDPDDRHVLAAAIHAGARVVVTFNLRDFPREALIPFGIEALHPDDFIAGFLERDALSVVSAAQRQRRQLKHPPLDIDQYLTILCQQGLVKTVDILQTYLK